MQRSKQWWKCGGGDGHAPCCRRDPYHWVIAQSFAWDRKKKNLWRPQQYKKHGFQCEKAVNDGMDLRQRWRGGKKGYKQMAGFADLRCNGQFLQVNVSTRISTKSFWESMRFPGFRRRILAENMAFGRFSASPCRQDHSAVVGVIMDSGRMATIFASLEFAGLFYLVCLQTKTHLTPHANLTTLYLSNAVEWDWLAAE